MAGPWEDFKAPSSVSNEPGPWADFGGGEEELPYPKEYSESRKKHAMASVDTAPSWLPGPLGAAYEAVNAALKGGSEKMYGGGRDVLTAPTMERAAHGLSQVARGAAQAASPAIVPVAAEMGVIPTALRTIAGLGGQQLVEAGGKLVRLPEGYSELAGDLAGLKAATMRGPSLPSAPGKGSLLEGAVKLSDIPGMLMHPVRTTGRVLGRVGENYIRSQETPATIPAPPRTAGPTWQPGPIPEPPAPPPATRSPNWKAAPIPGPEPIPVPVPTRSPNWKAAPIPKPEPPIPPPPPGRSPSWKSSPAPAPEPPPPPPKPTRSPSWSRGTSTPTPPPEQAATASPSGPTIQGKPVSPEAIEAEVKRVNEIEAARKSVPAPPGQGELAGTRLPDTEAGLHFGTHAAAEKLWGKSPHGQLSKLIEERYGPNRTQAFKKIPEGKKPLTVAERQDLLLHLLRVMPEPPK